MVPKPPEPAKIGHCKRIGHLSFRRRIMGIYKQGKRRPRYSLATLLWVMAFVAFWLPVVLAIVVEFQQRPTEAMIVLISMLPFLIPTLVTSVVLWQGMIESISHKK